MCLNNLVSSQVLPKFNHPFILSFNKQMMFGRIFFLFWILGSTAKWIIELWDSSSPKWEGQGKASVCCTNEQPECGLREFEKAACSYPFCNNWTSCSPWQGSGDFKGSKELVSFPCHPVSSGLASLATKSSPGPDLPPYTERTKEGDVLMQPIMMCPPHHGTHDAGCVLLL